ncbi:uncharacterized protein YoxC [Peribacillus deserti]|uniref:Uncharacterized protein YoxC n=1 Tax=Peribacillus deserti TaxID=673318 RepID=A0ABS2QLG7_9BACI|nr:DUF948 domain-containing protein [Peribacillus deserti]MBM7693614.1 uncharacterized protein YoxC [Peribacillus deserti]
MVIVYISLAVILLSLVFLGVYAFKTFKSVKPAINSLSETAARLQQKTDTIKVESTQLTENQQQIMTDIQVKKEAVTLTIENAKQTPKPIIQLWKKFKPAAESKNKQNSKTKKLLASYGRG